MLNAFFGYDYLPKLPNVPILPLGILSKAENFAIDQNSHYKQRQAYFPWLHKDGISTDYQFILDLMNQIRRFIRVEGERIPQVQWSSRFGSPANRKSPHFKVQFVGDSQEMFITEAIDDTRAKGGKPPWTWRTLPAPDKWGMEESSWKHNISLLWVEEMIVALGRIVVVNNARYGPRKTVRWKGWGDPRDPDRQVLFEPFGLGSGACFHVRYQTLPTFSGNVRVTTSRERFFGELISEPAEGVLLGGVSKSNNKEAIDGTMLITFFERTNVSGPQSILDLDPFEELYRGSWRIHNFEGEIISGSGAVLSELEMPTEHPFIQTKQKAGAMGWLEIQRKSIYDDSMIGVPYRDVGDPDPYAYGETHYGYSQGRGYGWVPMAPNVVPQEPDIGGLLPYVLEPHPFEGVQPGWYETDIFPLEGLNLETTDPEEMSANYGVAIGRVCGAPSVQGTPSKKYVFCRANNFCDFLFHEPFESKYKQYIEIQRQQFEDKQHRFVGDILPAWVRMKECISQMGFYEFMFWQQTVVGQPEGGGGPQNAAWLWWDSDLTPNDIFNECVLKYS